MPQSHPTTGPVRFLSPVRFFARKAESSARRIFTSVLWSHQATGPYGLTRLYTDGLVEWFARLQGCPVRAPLGNLQCFSYPTRPVRDPQGYRTAPLRTRNGIDTTKIDKNPAWASYLAVRAPRGLFKGCLGSENPYGARKRIMHALKLYGPRTGRQNS